jgi:uncharacterized SAM-binding protein YcdF (DUF218 family)
MMQSLFSFGLFRLPAAFITLTLLGVLLALRWRRIGLTLALVSSVCLLAAATPALSSYLLHRLETRLPADTGFRDAQAIVVLGGNVKSGDDEEIIPDALGLLSMERVVMAASAYRQLHLPVAVSGGRRSGARSSEAALMKTMLERDFTIPVAWSEDASRTTWENALYTARLLRPAGINTIVLVSQAWHLPRAIWAFERVGLAALPWPAGSTVLRTRHVSDFLPSIDGLANTKDAVHELIGGAYYRLRY